jgi:DNA invertase Pin-like site-specific DNA recombinase
MIGVMSLPVHPLTGQRVGYARISTASQNLDGQTDALNAAGCEKIFSDTASGRLAERPELTLCLGYLRAGDVLVVWRLDRLGRSLRHLVETVNALAERGVAFASLHEGIDTTTSTGRLIFHIFAALAEFERELIAERAAVGRQAARARGRLGGRPAKLSRVQLELAWARYDAGDVTVVEIAKALGVGRGTIYRALEKRPGARSGSATPA